MKSNQRTIKAALVLAAALLLASCDKDRENHYTIQRLAQVEECDTLTLSTCGSCFYETILP